MNQIEQDLRGTLSEYQIPGYMHDGAVRYVLHGVLPGDFLQAVMRNDLMDAVGRADRENQIALVQWAKWFFNEAPSSCWGSRERIAEWVNAKYQERQKAREEVSHDGQ